MYTLKFYFDDGSEYLAHYGVKGMHWGEWNEETRQRYTNDGKIHVINQATGEDYYEDPANYSNTPSGAMARTIDNTAYELDLLTKRPDYVLSSVAQRTFETGKKLVDGLLKGLGDVANAVKTGVEDIGLALQGKRRLTQEEVDAINKFNYDWHETSKRMDETKARIDKEQEEFDKNWNKRKLR